MKKICFFDLDGTVYLENELLPGALELFDYLNKNNIKYVFLTNNSSKNLREYIKKMNNFGIKCSKENFYSSVDHAIDYLTNKNYKSVYVVGTDSLIKEISGYVNVIDDLENHVEAVLVGFDTELTYQKLRASCKYVFDGSDLISTNIDLRCPISSNQFIPDCGAITSMIEKTTGKRSLYLGKPNPSMIMNVLNHFSLNKEDAIMVGDRLYTDILCGNNAGIDSCLVLTGETKLEDIKNDNTKPKYIIENLNCLIKFLGENHD